MTFKNKQLGTRKKGRQTMPPGRQSCSAKYSALGSRLVVSTSFFCTDLYTYWYIYTHNYNIFSLRVISVRARQYSAHCTALTASEATKFLHPITTNSSIGTSVNPSSVGDGTFSPSTLLVYADLRDRWTDLTMNFAERLRLHFTRAKPGVDESTSPSLQSRRSSSSTTREGSLHEPFETFKDKIRALTKSIGVFESISLQHHKGGSFNRVVIAHLTKSKQAIRGIYRISRLGERPCEEYVFEESLGHEVQDQVAVLQLLERRKIPAPKLLAFDAGRENPLYCRYIFAEFSYGICLQSIFDNMTLPERLNVVDGLLEFLLAAEGVTFTRPGTLCASRQPDMATKGSCFFDTKLPELQVEIEAFQTSQDVQLADSLADLMSRMLKAKVEGKEVWSGNRLLEKVYNISIKMKEHGVFDIPHKASVSTSCSILHHWDMFPRNILVMRPNSDQGWKVDMVIDWDNVRAVPAVLTRRPPYWLWDRTDRDKMTHVRSDARGHSDAGLLDPSRYHPGNRRLSTEDQQIRSYFEGWLIQGLGNIYKRYKKDDYYEEAYGKGRWVRRIARFTFEEWENENIPIIAHLEDDWATFKRGHPVKPPR
ncbi:hypothetical protein K470DRAFT_288844 [Piedraia hortae CBS 480.64]|uniref:Uncharacterized protein n=1 Tax=Piedraia hortae CBS 480.64 TaxID=1314780 RepID=A0A6A7BUN0_9PEZI|nr:hypothetical protein K470DRAFT_288844 [Piedraia hortae CBS 480.64]